MWLLGPTLIASFFVQALASGSDRACTNPDGPLRIFATDPQVAFVGVETALGLLPGAWKVNPSHRRAASTETDMTPSTTKREGEVAKLRAMWREAGDG